jgi:hypothetical protein
MKNLTVLFEAGSGLQRFELDEISQADLRFPRCQKGDRKLYRPRDRYIYMLGLHTRGPYTCIRFKAVYTFLPFIGCQKTEK